MKYEELVEKFNNKEPVTSADVNGVQVFMLIHDRFIKNVRVGSTLYEVNFISMEHGMASMLYINMDTCQSYHDANKIFKRMLEIYNSHEPIYVDLEDEYFEIKLEVLES